MNWIGYWFIYIFPLITLIGSYSGGIYFYLTPICTFCLIPFIDLFTGVDSYNPTPEETEIMINQKRYRYVLYIYVPLQLFMITWACYLASHHELSSYEWFGLILSIGVISGGMGINIAHELCHRHSKFEKLLAQVLWFSVCYMHFHIEHRKGHHTHVATPQDPATARLGESVYAFYPRTIINSYLSAWRIEARRLKLLNYSLWSYHNQMLWFAFLPFSFVLILQCTWGAQASQLFVFQSIIAILLLETINYLEHYGLQRRFINGKYEQVNIHHSWNANQKLTNYMLFKLQRHADHHAHPGRRYQILRSFEKSPQLPTGYGGMLLLALVPPFWRKVMDPIVKSYLSEVN